jgi:hypothetical protein
MNEQYISYETLLSYYPTYSILDEILSSGNYDSVNIYIDLKNNLQSLYMEHAVIGIVESSMRSRTIDTSIFSSILSFLSFHKLYSLKRSIPNFNFFIFFDSGTSFYHLNLSKKYKINRRIDELYGLDREKRDLFFTVMQKNLMLTERVCNRLPNTKVIRLDHLETDFIPYYLIRNGLSNKSSNPVHIVYSNDHDLLQCLQLPGNIFVFSKAYKTKKIVKKGDVLQSFLKFEKKLPDDYLTPVMAIMGDPGDSVDGIRNIGPKRIEAFIEEFISMTGGIINLRQNAYNGNNILCNPSSSLNKYLNKVIDCEEKEKIVSTNLKLVDFEILSMFLDNPDSTEMSTRRNQIYNCINTNSVVPIESMKPPLEKLGVDLQENLETIYFNTA